MRHEISGLPKTGDHPARRAIPFAGASHAGETRRPPARPNGEVRCSIIFQDSGIGLRLVPRHLIGIPRHARKYAAAALASRARNSVMFVGGLSSSRVKAE